MRVQGATASSARATSRHGLHASDASPDVYRPESPEGHAVSPDGLLPVIVYVHGGGSRMMSKDSHRLPGLIYGPLFT